MNSYNCKGLINLVKKNSQYLGLILIQGGNAFFPIILFPFIFSNLGAASFSDIVFSESVMMILFTLVVYSFDVTGIKSVEESLTPQDVCSVFYKILTLRLLICSVITIFLFALFLITENEIILLVIIWMFFPLGYALQSNYFFLAIAKNHILGFFVMVTRLVSATFIFLFVDEGVDVKNVVLYISSSFLISGLLAFFYCVIFEIKRFSIITFEDLSTEISKGLPILISNLSVSFFRGSNVLILGFFSSSNAVAIYSLAEKFIKTTQALMTPFNQLGLANFSRRYNSKVNLISLLWDCTKFQFKIACILIFAASLISFLALNSKYEFNFDVGSVLIIYFMMSPVIIFGLFNFMYGMVGLNVAGYKKEFSMMVFSVGSASVIITILSVHYYSQYGAAISLLLSEIILFILIFLYMRRINDNT